MVSAEVFLIWQNMLASAVRWMLWESWTKKCVSLRLRAILKGEARLFGSLMVTFKSMLVYKPHSGFNSACLKEFRVFIHSCLSHVGMSGDHEVEILQKTQTKPSSLGNVLYRYRVMRNIQHTLAKMNPLTFPFFLQVAIFLQRSSSEKNCSIFFAGMFKISCFEASTKQNAIQLKVH